MRFIEYFKLSSYLLVLCGLSSLVITRFFSIPFALLFVLVVLYSWKRDTLPWNINLPKRVWNGITVLYFLYAAYDVFFKSGDLVGQGINFTVYLQIHRLLNLKENRDYFLLYLLSFLHLLSASILTESITFSIPFFLYIILATWTFALYNIKAQHDESIGSDQKRKNTFYSSKTIITRRFLFATSILSLLIIFSTMVIFFSFPRMSLGYFYKKIGSRKSISGFSEKIDLGSIGSIMKNSDVVMRVEFPNDKISEEKLNSIYWRGTAFDIYNGRRWSHYDGTKEKKLIDSMTGVLELTKEKIKSDILVQRIFLEPLDTRIVFAADKVKVLRWEKLKIERYLRRNIGIERDVYDTNYFFTNLSSDQKYLAYSELAERINYKKVEGAPAWPKDYPYLYLPYKNERIEELANKIVEGATTDYEKALRIKEYLSSNYVYSDQNLNVRNERPLEFFLFGLKRGHCEFFSTAMSILLRYVGVPSRNVVGFRGGAVNEVGNYIVVRQSDAHSWVEANIYGNGWMRFDPTPGEVGGEKKIAKSLGFFAKYIDYLKLRWNKYIIDYDLRAQAKYTRLFWTGTKKIITTSSTLFEGQSNFANRLKLYVKNLNIPEPIKPLIVVVFGGFVLFVVFLILKFGRRRRSTIQARGGEFYAKMLKLLSKKGIHKKHTETPLEFGRDVISNKGNNFLSVITITENYYAARFGNKELSKETQENIASILKSLSKA